MKPTTDMQQYLKSQTGVRLPENLSSVSQSVIHRS
jgi:hypothetical protein